MRILYIIDQLDGDGSARQLRLLAPAVARTTCSVEICCLGCATRQTHELQQAGIPVHILGWTRWLDVPALWALRGLLRRGGFDLVHVWRLAALRAVAAAAPMALPRVVVRAHPPCNDRLNWWDRRVLRRVRCVELATAVVGPASRAGLATGPARLAGPTTQRIACAGRLERGRGFREAIWAVDILRYVFPDVQLFIAGAGPRRPDLEAMIQRLSIDHAHLLGDTVEPGQVLAAADVCWVPSRTDHGRQAALEALASGQAVVASDVPCLRELIRDGETGCLVPPGDPVALARQTRALLQDHGLRERLGQAARAEVLTRFALDRVATQWHRLYNDLAA